LVAGSTVVISALVCLLGHLGAIGLVGPDEPRYAWIARAMAQSGDWVTPRLYGSPWFEKPILYYWTAAVGFRLHLPAEWAARLPSAVAALVATLAIAWVASRHYANEKYCPWSPELLAPLFFATSVGAIGFSRAATPDMLFAASIMLAMVSAAAVLRRAGALRASPEVSSSDKRNDTASIALFGFCLGLAVLAKGPAAIILAAGALGIWAFAAGQWRATLRFLHPFALAAFCVAALPWYVICARRNPEFIHIFIFQHNFERYLTPVFQHRQPFWFFVPITLLAVIPWVAFMLPAARGGLRLWRENSWRESPAFFFSCWALFPILFFSFSQSKLPSYILPSIPPLALVLAIAASQLIAENSRRDGWIFALLGVTWIGLGIGALIWLGRLQQDAKVSVRTPIIIFAVLGLIASAAIIARARSHHRMTVWFSLVLVCAAVETTGITILPKLDQYYSARQLGTMLSGDLRPDRLFICELPRAWQYGLAFYVGRQLPEWPATDHEAALVLTTRKTCEEFHNQGLSNADCEQGSGEVIAVPLLARPHSVPAAVR
jgi:4-amino-4-deoxy-L-arabinose transferase-like glycosyltransferase